MRIISFLTLFVLIGCSPLHPYFPLLTKLPAGANGADGANGAAGIDGQDGENGQNGINGRNGIDAELPAYSVVAAINPCGDAPGRVDEVLLLMQNGQVLSSYSDAASGLNTRFAILAPGTYTTTDGDNCTFTLTTNGSLSYESKSY